MSVASRLVAILVLALSFSTLAQEAPKATQPGFLDLKAQPVAPPSSIPTYSVTFYVTSAAKIVITGDVTDIKGIPIKNATVSMASPETGPLLSLQTNEKGLFTAVLPAGIYPPRVVNMKVEGIGFSTRVFPVFLLGGHFTVHVALLPYEAGVS